MTFFPSLSLLRSSDFWDHSKNKSPVFKSFCWFPLLNSNLTTFRFRKWFLKSNCLIASVKFILRHLLFSHWTKDINYSYVGQRFIGNLLCIYHLSDLEQCTDWRLDRKRNKLECHMPYDKSLNRGDRAMQKGWERKREREREATLYSVQRFRDQGRYHT